MKRFEKIAKRYALANSYFKNRLLIWPDTLCEIHDYLQQHGELPFRYDGDNWPYDALCEQQKRRGVRLSQYLTPDATARQIAALAVRYFENDSRIMDVCCGTGQLTRALIAAGVHPSPGDRSVLLLPHGFIDKQRPKGIQETLRQFEVLYRTPMQERFARTNVTAEIVVLERR